MKNQQPPKNKLLNKKKKDKKLVKVKTVGYFFTNNNLDRLKIVKFEN